MDIELWFAYSVINTTRLLLVTTSLSSISIFPISLSSSVLFQFNFNFSVLVSTVALTKSEYKQ